MAKPTASISACATASISTGRSSSASTQRRMAAMARSIAPRPTRSCACTRSSAQALDPQGSGAIHGRARRWPHPDLCGRRGAADHVRQRQQGVRARRGARRSGASCPSRMRAATRITYEYQDTAGPGRRERERLLVRMRAVEDLLHGEPDQRRADARTAGSAAALRGVRIREPTRCEHGWLAGVQHRTAFA